MNVTKIISIMLYSCFFALLFFSNLNAATSANYAAAISFSNPDDAKWTVYNAYLTINKINSLLIKANKLTYKVLNTNNGYDNLYYLDLNFQSLKHDVEKMANRQIRFHVFNNNEFFIDIYNDGNHLTFYIPKLNVADLNINGTSIDCVRDAQDAINRLTSAKYYIDAILPDSYLPPELSKFIASKKSLPKQMATFKNILYISSKNNVDALLYSLFSLNEKLTNDLQEMMKLANDAACGTHSDSEMSDLNIQYQAMMSELSRNLASNCEIGYVGTFDDNRLTFLSDGKSREYNFPTSNLTTLNLEKDTILNQSVALDAHQHINSDIAWIRDWMIDGVVTPSAGKRI